jgi:hypothetical protein
VLWLLKPTGKMESSRGTKGINYSGYAFKRVALYQFPGCDDCGQSGAVGFRRMDGQDWNGRRYISLSKLLFVTKTEKEIAAHQITNGGVYSTSLVSHVFLLFHIGFKRFVFVSMLYSSSPRNLQYIFLS